jgi:hypothetical protein
MVPLGVPKVMANYGKRVIKAASKLDLSEPQYIRASRQFRTTNGVLLPKNREINIVQNGHFF